MLILLKCFLGFFRGQNDKEHLSFCLLFWMHYPPRGVPEQILLEENWWRNFMISEQIFFRKLLDRLYIISVVILLMKLKIFLFLVFREQNVKLNIFVLKFQDNFKNFKHLLSKFQTCWISNFNSFKLINIYRRHLYF